MTAKFDYMEKYPSMLYCKRTIKVEENTNLFAPDTTLFTEGLCYEVTRDTKEGIFATSDLGTDLEISKLGSLIWFNTHFDYIEGERSDKVEIDITITAKDISNIMSTAIETGNGISLWCEWELKDKDKRGFTYTVDAVAYGATLLITPNEAPTDELEGLTIELNRDKLISGIKQYINLYPNRAEFYMDGKKRVIETGNWDLNDCDNIVQLALFGEIVYG